MHTGQSVMSPYKNHMDDGFQSEAKQVRGLAQQPSKRTLEGKTGRWLFICWVSLAHTVKYSKSQSHTDDLSEKN